MCGRLSNSFHSKLFNFKKDHYRMATKIADHYGDTVGVWLGSEYLIFLADPKPLEVSILIL